MDPGWPIEFLRPLLRRKGRGTLISGIGVVSDASPKQDYRVPDLTFLAAGREALIVRDGTCKGGPDAVLAVRSPADETYEKLPFFAQLGVREMIVIDRDTKRPEVFRLAGSQYLAVSPGLDGFVLAETLGIRFRVVDGPRLVVEDAAEPSLQMLI